MFHSFTISNILPLIKSKTPFVFLDTAKPDKENRYSYLFFAPHKTLSAKTPEQISLLLEQLNECSHKFWVAGFLNYEASFGLEERLTKVSLKEDKNQKYLGWFGVFHEPYIFDHALGTWNKQPPFLKLSNTPSPVAPLKITLSHGITEEVYKSKIKAIKRYIARGHTYQINFTYDVLLKAHCPAFELYRALRENQAASFCSFISVDGFQVASFSPELFFRKYKRTILVKPMKGTALRGKTTTEDSAYTAALSLDAKNQSENVMIVDLMRNDLGKICVTGSVKTTNLFSVEKLKTVLQMTSTVKGVLRKSVTIADIFRNLLPSGSVTGTPKIRSMEIIQELESGSRDVYCGAIGFVSPYGSASFSVPIRTLQSTPQNNVWKYRVGSAIVWDSRAADEWRECAAKCGFLTAKPSSFELFESMLWNKRIVYKIDHINRLKSSASFFDYPFDKNKVFEELTSLEKQLTNLAPQKARLFLNKNGSLRSDFSSLGANDFSKNAKVAIAFEPIDERNPLMFHKTTERPWFTNAAPIIANQGLFDVIFKNSKGEITEGSRSNIFIRKGHILYTPPIRCGLLTGVLRQNLIRRGKCKEKILRLIDLKKADAIYCGNSVRGLVEVERVET